MARKLPARGRKVMRNVDKIKKPTKRHIVRGSRFAGGYSRMTIYADPWNEGRRQRFRRRTRQHPKAAARRGLFDNLVYAWKSFWATPKLRRPF